MLEDAIAKSEVHRLVRDPRKRKALSGAELDVGEIGLPGDRKHFFGDVQGDDPADFGRDRAG